MYQYLLLLNGKTTKHIQMKLNFNISNNIRITHRSFTKLYTIITNIHVGSATGIG